MNKVFFRPAYYIKFVEEGNSRFAISEFEPWKGYICEELLWAEVTPENTVIWQDAWQFPVKCETFYKAERYIRDNYLQHTPVILGNRYKNGQL